MTPSQMIIIYGALLSYLQGNRKNTETLWICHCAEVLCKSFTWGFTVKEMLMLHFILFFNSFSCSERFVGFCLGLFFFDFMKVLVAIH